MQSLETLAQKMDFPPLVTVGLDAHVIDIICRSVVTLEDLQPLNRAELMLILVLNKVAFTQTTTTARLRAILLMLLQNSDCRIVVESVPSSFGINVGHCLMEGLREGHPINEPARFTLMDHCNGCVMQFCHPCLADVYLQNWEEDPEIVDPQFRVFAVACQRCLRRHSDFTIFENGRGTWQMCHPCAVATFNV